MLGKGVWQEGFAVLVKPSGEPELDRLPQKLNYGRGSC